MSDDRFWIVVPVKQCARCGENHESVTFHKITRPITDDDGTVWTHYGTCPKLDEPILFRVQDTSARSEL